MLGSVGLNRSDVYITNILPWRPPGNRKPSEDEIALFTPFVRRHISLINPRILLLLGGSAVSALMNITAGITKTRGRWMTYPDADTTVQVMASFHPAFLLRTPAQKKLAWRDFLAVKQKLRS
jgi:DNA polymerase